MHVESFELMKYFAEKYLDRNKKLRILDIGSCDVNGSYKSIFINDKWEYKGLDMVPGKNVDIVSKSEYDFGVEEQFDVVVSGNCLEHVEAPWKWIKEVEKVTKPNGIVCIITPFSIGEHRYPVDCWRILPDGYKFLFEKESSFTLIESKINKPDPEIRYRYFQDRPEKRWMLKYLPETIKKRFFAYNYPNPMDTFAIARKIA